MRRSVVVACLSWLVAVACAPTARQQAQRGDSSEGDELLMGALGDGNDPPEAAAETSTRRGATTPLPVLPPPPMAPAARTDAPPFVVDPSLGAAESAYTSAMAPTLDVGVQPTAEDLAHEMLARIGARLSAIRTARAAYDVVATTRALHVRAAERMGDLWDALGAEISSVPIAMPADLAQEISRASPDVQLEIHQELVDRLHAALVANQAFPVFCEALASYREASAEGAEVPRASAQVAAYGESFAATCDDGYVRPLP